MSRLRCCCLLQTQRFSESRKALPGAARKKNSRCPRICCFVALSIRHARGNSKRIATLIAGSAEARSVMARRQETAHCPLRTAQAPQPTATGRGKRVATPSLRLLSGPSEFSVCNAVSYYRRWCLCSKLAQRGAWWSGAGGWRWAVPCLLFE